MFLCYGCAWLMRFRRRGRQWTMLAMDYVINHFHASDHPLSKPMHTTISSTWINKYCIQLQEVLDFIKIYIALSEKMPKHFFHITMHL